MAIVYHEPGHVREEFEADFIVETGAVCGGRSIIPSVGYFSTIRAEGEFAIQSEPSECYREFNCDWQQTGVISGYVWNTFNSGTSNEYKAATYAYRTQYTCDQDGESVDAPMQALTIISADSEDCAGE
jgi:hypothetical protein